MDFFMDFLGKVMPKKPKPKHFPPQVPILLRGNLKHLPEKVVNQQPRNLNLLYSDGIIRKQAV
jgi:hypothetical protein